MSVKQPAIISFSVFALLLLGLLLGVIYFNSAKGQREDRISDATLEAQQDFTNIEDALEKYYQSNNKYPEYINVQGKSISNAFVGDKLELPDADVINSFDLYYRYSASGAFRNDPDCKYTLSMYRSSTLGDSSITEYEREKNNCN